MKLVRAVLFDWDGTLVDSMEVKIRNAGNLFQLVFHLPSGQVEEAYRLHSGVPRRELFDAILKQLGHPALEEEAYRSLSNSFSDMNRASLRDPDLPGLVPPATYQVLENLLQAGCRLFVSSSADSLEVRDIAEAHGLADYFTRSGGEMLGSYPGFSKGSQHVKFVLNKFMLSLNEMIFVGDDPADIQLGRSAGVYTVARVGTLTADKLSTYAPDAIVNSLDELTSLPGLKFGGPERA
jgi:phosphoglycolate phosphatase-like HAD superfamily hydrolase